jgi:hypothetical protein
VGGFKMVNGNEPVNIIREEALTRETIKEKHKREIEILTGILNSFLSGFSYMGLFTLQEDNESEYILLLILMRSLNSIRCSIDLMLKGYYSQSMSLLRTVTEDWFICGTVKENEKVRDCLLRDKAKMPKYSELATQMNAINIYKGDYHYQSKFTHSSRLSLRVMYDLEKKEVILTPKYDEILFLLCVESLMRVSLLILDYMGLFLLYVDKVKAEEWNKQNNQHFNNMTNWLGELREKYGGENEVSKSD